MHSYPSPPPVRSHRDPQLVADPAKLPYDEEMGHIGASSGYGAVNPNVMYAGGRSVFVPHPVVVREQYCLCAPQTKAERRLLVTVIVLAVVCVALLAALCSILPALLCDGECEDGKGGGGGLADLLPFMSNPLQPITS